MKTVIIGAGGQSRIVYEILSYDPQFNVVAFVDNVVRNGDEKYKGIPILGDHSVLPGLLKSGARAAIIAVGDNEIRAAHFNKLTGMGFQLINAVHPTASISPSVKLGKGVIISIGAIISTGVKIGNNVVIDAGAIIDHENEIGDHVHIGTGCSLAGRVIVKSGAFVSIGTAVREYVTIGKNSTIGAGSVVLENIPDNAMAAGTPAIVSKPE